MGLLDDSEERNARDQITPQWYAALYVKVCGGKSVKTGVGNKTRAAVRAGIQRVDIRLQGPGPGALGNRVSILGKEVGFENDWKAHRVTARVWASSKGGLQISVCVMASKVC